MSALESRSAPVSDENTPAGLFAPLSIRGVTLRNRIAVSPMCEYSSEEGFANDWHLVHLGSRSVGGAGLVLTEAAAVEARGRISPADLGIWTHQHIEPLARITRFVKLQGGVPGIQLAHAGRKASTDAPWRGGKPLSLEEEGWEIVGPSALPFDEGYATPGELTIAGIRAIQDAFVAAAKRSLDAGFHIVELHCAHGYLAHEFLSPLSNHRKDAYGGSFENRTRFVLELVDEVRAVWPERLPLFLRISATDYVEGGWNVDESVELARIVRGRGVDLVDCSSGGNVAGVAIPLKPGYQVPFAERIRREAGVMTGAVGMITEAEQADTIVKEGSADIVLLAREFLREPYWAIKAANELGIPVGVPDQYARAYIKPK
jgi:2,4-dienoyl-CoA reductase-like NADH-dependent reductase (Old Yellow Enzyme family)